MLALMRGKSLACFQKQSDKGTRCAKTTSMSGPVLPELSAVTFCSKIKGPK